MKALRASARAMREVPLSRRPEEVALIMPAIISSLLIILGSPSGLRCWRELVAVVIRNVFLCVKERVVCVRE